MSPPPGSQPARLHSTRRRFGGLVASTAEQTVPERSQPLARYFSRQNTQHLPLRVSREQLSLTERIRIPWLQ